MNSKEEQRLLNATNVVADILELRGYPSVPRHTTFASLVRKYSPKPTNAKTLSEALSTTIHYKDGHKMQVRYILTETVTNAMLSFAFGITASLQSNASENNVNDITDSFDKMRDELTENTYKQEIIVVCEHITDTVQTFLLMAEERLGIRIWVFNLQAELQRNPLHHVAVSEYRLVSANDVLSAGIHPEELPVERLYCGVIQPKSRGKAPVGGPIAKFLGAQDGDVFEITRMTDNGLPMIGWRIVRKVGK